MTYFLLAQLNLVFAAAHLQAYAEAIRQKIVNGNRAGLPFNLCPADGHFRHPTDDMVMQLLQNVCRQFKVVACT